jgi:hypothetical protein
VQLRRHKIMKKSVDPAVVPESQFVLAKAQMRLPAPHSRR